MLLFTAHCASDDEAPADAGHNPLDAAMDARSGDGDGDGDGDAGQRDAGEDADVPDTGAADASTLDANLEDAEIFDAGEDAGEDAGDAGDAALPCESSLPVLASAPATLSAAGLYTDIASKAVRASMLPFTPQFVLWSDGAVKSRWMYLPECEPIDSSDMDSWSFPVGARAFKEFVVDGKRIETRLVHRYGEGADDFLYAHYLWNDDETEATLITASTEPSALINPRGVTYTVPAPETCARCHGETGGPQGGLPQRFLGFSAISLSHASSGAGETTLQSLSDQGRLSHPSANIVVPGTEVERAGIGYLHANCGFCHNDSADGVSIGTAAQRMKLLLKTTDDSLAVTGALTTAVNVAPVGYAGIACTHRIYPADPGLAETPSGPVLSCIYERMNTRGDFRQMPPIDSHVVDTAGLATLQAFIRALPAP